MTDAAEVSPGEFPPGQEPYQPARFAFDAESEAEIAVHLAKYPPGRQASAVIPLLYVVQKQMKRTTGSAIRVFEVATFYLMFNLRPIGKWHLQLCTTTPCWLRGSDAVVAACREATGIEGWGETSADGMFTMTEVECVGACVNAPILQVNDDFYEDMDADRTRALLAALRDGTPPPAGSMAGRQASAPEGGPMTLTTLAFAPGEQADAG
jgi:NADH:ubiquinone oxidoreductase subunit E